MLEKIKNFFKRLWERFERVGKEVATPVAPPQVESPVGPSKPVSGDSKEPVTKPAEKPYDPRVANPGLGAWLGSDAVTPVDYGPPAGGTQTDRSGFLLVKGSPRVNVLKPGKTYMFVAGNTVPGEKVRIRVLEVTGSMDVFTSGWLVHESGALLSPEKSYNRHGGFHETISPGGSITLCLEITGTCPYGVEWV